MRSGMGNLLETDSDVASVSDGERERTDGDGMESDGLPVNNKNGSSSGNNSTGPVDINLGKTVHVPSTDINTTDAINQGDVSSLAMSSAAAMQSKNGDDRSTKSLCSDKASSSFSDNARKLLLVSPRELPPRSQLIQIKPTFKGKRKDKDSPSKARPDGVNKQKNPRFVPYEPYKGAVRPMVGEGQSSRRHSRTTSDASVSSVGTSLEHAISSIRLTANHPQGLANAQNVVKDNAHDQSVGDNKSSKNPNRSADISASNQIKKQEQIIEKQTHAVTLLKERLKIAEKDNNDLHRENIRLKKLLVDSLSGDVLQGRMDLLTQDTTKIPCSASESVDILSNEIEVWRSKFLSSCVLVEQLTRENGALNDAVGTAANLLKDIKLTSSLSPELFDEVNTWLRANRGTGTILPQNNNISDDVDS